MSETSKRWAERVARWRRSGLSARVYARSVGINASTLTYWAWRLGRETAPTAKKSPSVADRRPSSAVDFVEVVAPVVGDERFELELGDGRRVRIPAGFDRDALVRLLGVLEPSR